MSAKSQTKARILSILTVSAIVGTGFLPENHWFSNVEVLVHVWTWCLMILAVFGLFIEDLPPYNPWFAIPLTVAWICALAFVGWTVLLGVYAVLTLIATVRRIDL